ncbi:alpha/beta hydrolase family protein [Methylocaldum sp.]|uniref:alpha/beta hydrolase family protein n=1 Tax=Methylocaldum sp. TaxID=1969727 RepID=UPI002D30E3D2|nr:alpha/beta fold hydrolase [Methylocaldum sp.]HYE34096.1 alpha/beta fold hydrolase [Methylocaldum sp.]
MRLLLILCLALVPRNPAAAQVPGVTQEPARQIGGVPVSLWTYPSDGLKVRGLLFLPRTKDKLPLVLFNHDGVSGISKEHMRACARLARAGYVVFAPSYRGEDGSEGFIEVAAGEVRDVLNVLPLLARVPGIDGGRVALVGLSHGALISVLAAARQPEIDAVVAADGVMDIYGWWRYLQQTGTLGQDNLTQRVYGDGPDDKPLAFSTRHALAQIPKLKAPVLILHGDQDDIVPAEQALTFKAELDRAGVPAIVKVYPHCGHGFLVYVPYLQDGVAPAECTEAEQAWQAVLAFLKEHLKS